MKEKENNSLSELRKRAEAKLELGKKEFTEETSEETSSLLHELRTHQIELEMQNEELRRSQLEQQEMVEKYTDFYDFSPVGYVSLNEKNIIEDANLTAAALLGAERANLIGNSFSRFIEHEDQDIFYLQQQKLLKKGGQRAYELRIKRAAGGAFFARIESIVRKGEKEGEVQLRLVIIDITSHKKLEKELCRSNAASQATLARLQGLLEALPDLVFIIGEDGLVIEALSSLENENLIYRSAESVKGDYIQKILPKNEAKLVMETVGLTIKTKKSQKLEYFLHVPEGPRWFEGSTALLKEEFEGKRAVVWCARNITERKAMEEALQRSEKKYRDIIDTCNEGFNALNKDREIVEANNSFCRMLGYQREELLGKKLVELVPDDEKSFMRKQLAEIDATRYRRYETVFIAKDGSNVSVLVNATTVQNAREGFPATFAFITDLTEQKKFQAKLVETEKLSTIGTFISGIAHELNNPLTSILGFSQKLALTKNVPEDILSLTRIISEQAERTAQIVKDLLLYSRKEEVAHEVFCLGRPLESSLRILSPIFQGDAISINTNFSPDALYIKGSEYQIQQVIINILTNAHQEMRKHKGEKVLNISTTREGNQVRIVIENTGKPIPEEIIGRIFDPFFTTKNAASGTGLGLYICHSIVKNHGGSIEVKNVDKGIVRFDITLPICFEKIEKAEEPVAVAPKKVRNSRVLVVENEIIIRDLFKAILSEEGHVCVEAPNGKKAVEILKRENFDLIVSDLKMDVMDGYELGKWLSRNKPEYLKKLVLISGDISKEVSDFSAQHGCEFLAKPFGLDDILQVINKHLPE